MNFSKIAIAILISAVVFTGCGEDEKKEDTPKNDSSQQQEGSSNSLDSKFGAEEVYGIWVKPSKSVCESNGGEYSEYRGLNDIDKKEYSCDASWENSNKICSAIGGELPSVELLMASLTDCGGVIDGSYANKNDNKDVSDCYRKAGFTPEYYWSSTTSERDSNKAWFLRFLNGSKNFNKKTYGLTVQCVREN